MQQALVSLVISFNAHVYAYRLLHLSHSP